MRGTLCAVRRARAVSALFAALGVAACTPLPVRPEPARLRVVAVPETATVYVDDRFAGSARLLALRPLAFAPGARHVTVQADGYFPHDVTVTLRPGITTVRVGLRAVPP